MQCCWLHISRHLSAEIIPATSHPSSLCCCITQQRLCCTAPGDNNAHITHKEQATHHTAIFTRAVEALAFALWAHWVDWVVLALARKRAVADVG